MLPSEEGGWIPNSKKSICLLWRSLEAGASSRQVASRYHLSAEWRAGSGLVPRKLSLIFSLPGPGVLGLKAYSIWSVEVPWPSHSLLSLVQVKNEVEKLPRQQRKESMKQKMEEHAQKKQLLVSPRPSAGEWRGWGVSGLSPWMVTRALLCLCPCPALWILTYLSFWINQTILIIIPVTISPMQPSLIALAPAGSELSHL